MRALTQYNWTCRAGMVLTLNELNNIAARIEARRTFVAGRVARGSTAETYLHAAVVRLAKLDGFLAALTDARRMAAERHINSLAVARRAAHRGLNERMFAGQAGLGGAR